MSRTVSKFNFLWQNHSTQLKCCGTHIKFWKMFFLYDSILDTQILDGINTEYDILVLNRCFLAKLNPKTENCPIFSKVY